MICHRVVRVAGEHTSPMRISELAADEIEISSALVIPIPRGHGYPLLI